MGRASLVGRVRWIGLLEGISFLLLLSVGMPLKHAFGMPMPLRFLGSAHGILFLLYLWSVSVARGELDWPNKRTFALLGASLLPFGTFFFDRSLRDEQRLLAGKSS